MHLAVIFRFPGGYRQVRTEREQQLPSHIEPLRQANTGGCFGVLEQNRKPAKQTVPGRLPARGQRFHECNYFLRAGFRFETIFRKPVAFCDFALEARFESLEDVFDRVADLVEAVFTDFLALPLPRRITAVAFFGAVFGCSSDHPCASLTAIMEARISRHVPCFIIVALGNMHPSQHICWKARVLLPLASRSQKPACLGMSSFPLGSLGRQ